MVKGKGGQRKRNKNKIRKATVEETNKNPERERSASRETVTESKKIALDSPKLVTSRLHEGGGL